MYSKSSNKAPKGTIGIQSRNGRLQFNLPRGWANNDEQIRFSSGLPDTPEGRGEAERIKAEMERDHLLKLLPETLEWIKAKYLNKSCVDSGVTPIKPEPNLGEVWDGYIDHLRILESKGELSPNTLAKQYKTFTNYIKGTKSRRGDDIKLPTLDLSKAAEIKNYCEQVIPLDSCKRFITRLSKACDWAKDSGMISANPFMGMASKVRVEKSTEDEDIDPFTAAERDKILETLLNNTFCSKYSRVKHSHYYNWVFFLFHTGCRTGEAIVLRWKDIEDDFSFINFSRAIAKSEKGGRVEKLKLKTQERRRFGRCNPKLREFLASIKPENAKPEDLVFPSPTGTWIDDHNFSNRIWRGEEEGKGILDRLGFRYRKFYQTRHTFITLALESGLDAKDVARLVGNSPKTIYEHYAGNKRDMEIPEF